jgi:hypothetical protein
MRDPRGISPRSKGEHVVEARRDQQADERELERLRRKVAELEHDQRLKTRTIESQAVEIRRLREIIRNRERMRPLPGPAGNA